MINENTIIDVLNDLTEKDPKAIVALLSCRPPTNHKVLEEYDIRMEHHDYATIGILSILNKIIEDSGKRIKLEYLVDNFTGIFELKGFKLEDRE